MSAPRRTRIDDFKLEAVLGKGQFGTVYKAVATASGRVFALKGVATPKLTDAEEVIKEGKVGLLAWHSALLDVP